MAVMASALRMTVRAAFGMTLALLPMITPGSAAAQVSNQSFEVIPEVARATVGDSVPLRFRVRLDERDLLFDTVPQLVNALPPGVRILSVEKLRRAPDRIFHGRARIAFYRTGRRSVPVFGLPFMRAVKGLQRGTLASDSAFVDITPLAPAGNPPLKDIRELERSRRPIWPLLIAVGSMTLVLLAGYWRLRKRRASRPAPAETVSAVPPPPLSAYALARNELGRIERERWPVRGQVGLHYESIVNALRGYLESAEELPARERTTGEVLWSLPSHLVEDGLRDHFRELLEEADLVKFARLRPSPADAQLFIGRCRKLLDQWHENRSSAEMADALR